MIHSLSHYGDAKDIAGLPHYINKMFIRLSQIDDKLPIVTPEPDCDDNINNRSEAMTIRAGEMPAFLAGDLSLRTMVVNRFKKNNSQRACVWIVL